MIMPSLLTLRRHHDAAPLPLETYPQHSGTPQSQRLRDQSRDRLGTTHRQALPPPSPGTEVTAGTDTHASGIGSDLQNGIDAGDPLTAKGRIKKRHREKDVFDPDDPDRYHYKAYHIRRAFDLFGHIPTIVNEGIKRRAKEATGELQAASHLQSDQDYETFKLILSHLDGLSDDIVRLKRNPKEFRALVRKIREAADQARNNDTANLKKDVGCMLTPDGSSVLTVLSKGKKASSKHDRGFENDVMGRYLCPISLDWDDAAVRKEIREGKHAILACDWPRLLYANCDCNLDDLELGLGRNMALVRVVKYLFTGRSAAFSDNPGGKTTRSGNAALAGMKQITPRVVAYAACMLRYAISNEESWSAIDNEFNLQEFYWHVVNIFDDSDDFGRELLAWWNMKVFGTSLETTMQPAAPSATVALSLLKTQRAAKRASNRIFRDISNDENETQHERRDSIESEDGDDVGSPLWTRAPSPSENPSRNLETASARCNSSHAQRAYANPEQPSEAPRNPSPRFSGATQAEERPSNSAFYVRPVGPSTLRHAGHRVDRDVSASTPTRTVHSTPHDPSRYFNTHPGQMHTPLALRPYSAQAGQHHLSPVRAYTNTYPPPPPWQHALAGAHAVSSLANSLSGPSNSRRDDDN